MTHTQPTPKRVILDYLRQRRTPLAAGSLHADLLAADPALYVGVVRDPAADLSHKRKVLATLLQAEGTTGLPSLLHDLWSLDAVEGLAVVEAIRLERLNGRRARTLGLQFLLGHPRLAHLAATRRQRVVRLLKHLLGERTWSAAVRFLRTPTPVGERFLRRHLLRHTRTLTLAREALAYLARLPLQATDPSLKQALAARDDLNLGAGLPAETLFGLRSTFHPTLGVREVRALAPAAPRTDGIGPVTAIHKQALLQNAGESPLEQDALRARLEEASTWLPTVEARVSVVLDLSASMAGSGERHQHAAALGLALVRLLEASCTRLSVFQVGGAGSVHEQVAPQPEGWGDLATAIIDAARAGVVPGETPGPDLILVVTDGYENRRQGDAAEVVRGVRQLSPSTHVVQVLPRFTRSEDLSERRLGADITLLPIDQEEDVRELSAQAVLASAGERLSPDQVNQLQELLFTG